MRCINENQLSQQITYKYWATATTFYWFITCGQYANVHQRALLLKFRGSARWCQFGKTRISRKKTKKVILGQTFQFWSVSSASYQTALHALHHYVECIKRKFKKKTMRQITTKSSPENARVESAIELSFWHSECIMTMRTWLRRTMNNEEVENIKLYMISSVRLRTIPEFQAILTKIALEPQAKPV